MPVNKDCLIISSLALTKGETSLSSLVRRQVDDSDEEIVEVRSGKSTGEKQSKYISAFTAVSMVPAFEDKSVPVEDRR